MDSIEFRFCRVCLVPEDDEKFFSIFNDNAKVAQQLHNLTNIFPVDVDEKVPSLICNACTKEVDATDLLRRRILDAHDHITMMTVEREIDYFEELLKEIKDDIERAKKREERRKSLEDESEKSEFKHVETPINTPALSSAKASIIVPAGKVFEAKICLKRSKECEDQIAKIMKNKPVSAIAPMTVIPMSIIQMSVNNDKKSRRLKAHPKTLKLSKENKKLKTIKNKLPKKKSLESRKRKIADFSDQQDNQNKHKRFKKTQARKVQTTFECDTCKEFFYTCNELDEHLKIHRIVKTVPSWPWHDLPQSTNEIVIIDEEVFFDVNHQMGNANISSSSLADVIEID